MGLTKNGNRRAIHAFIVNYNQPEFCQHAIQKLVSNNRTDLIKRQIDLCVHWIDNSGKSPCQFRDQAQDFVSKSGVKWNAHLHATNLGFGQACQGVFELIEPSDHVLLINPDAELSGLATMFDSLTTASEFVAGVGPQSYWDSNKRFYLPPAWLIDEEFVMNECLARHLPFYARYRSRELRKAALKIWNATQVTPIEAISGACGLFRASTLHRVGGLFDQAFFMYWEDTELMLRLNRAGFKTLLDPSAQLIHHYVHTIAKSKMIESGRETYLDRLAILPHWFQIGDQNTEALWRCKTIYLAEGKDLRLRNPELARSDVKSTNSHSQLWELGLSSEFVPTIGTFSMDLLIPWQLLARVSEMPIFIRMIGNLQEYCWKVEIIKSSKSS